MNNAAMSGTHYPLDKEPTLLCTTLETASKLKSTSPKESRFSKRRRNDNYHPNWADLSTYAVKRYSMQSKSQRTPT